MKETLEEFETERMRSESEEMQSLVSCLNETACLHSMQECILQSAECVGERDPGPRRGRAGAHARAQEDGAAGQSRQEGRRLPADVRGVKEKRESFSNPILVDEERPPPSQHAFDEVEETRGRRKSQVEMREHGLIDETGRSAVNPIPDKCVGGKEGGGEEPSCLQE